MITIKKKHNLDLENDMYFNDLQNQFGNVFRYVYNRMVKDGVKSLSELEKIVKTKMNNIEPIDASWIKCAVKKAATLKAKKDKDKKDKDKTKTKSKDKTKSIDISKEQYRVYFGGKGNFFKRKYKKIDSYDKSIPLNMRGSISDSKGNRKASIEDDMFIFKPCKGKSYEIKLCLSKNEAKMLRKIQEGCENRTDYFNFEIDKTYVYISINEPVLEEKHKAKKNRILGIDLNPNYIAVSILDFKNDIYEEHKEIYKEIIDLKHLNNTASTNKKHHEVYQINKYILKLCQSFNVEYVSMEDLNISSSDKGKGKTYNQLVNNTWLRNLVVNNLTKILNIYSIKNLKVGAHYSSFMGQLRNPVDYDSIAASKEIAFRGYLVTLERSLWAYTNNFLDSDVPTHGKNMVHCNTYRDLYEFYKGEKKKPGYSYRFLFNDSEKLKWSCFRLKSSKSLVDLITF